VIGAKVDVRSGWGEELAREVNMRVRGMVEAASETGADEAAAAAGARRRTGRMANIDKVPVVGTPDGWEGGFRSKAWYSGFQSRGTLGSRKRSVKSSTARRRQSLSGQARFAKVAGSRGISPLGHEETGLRAAKKHLVELLNRL
jgi:hypothetical protein